MKIISSTEARQNFSDVIATAKYEPIAISKQEKEIAVVLSSKRYKELKCLEDILYGKAAELALKEGFASEQEAKNLLDSIPDAGV